MLLQTTGVLAFAATSAARAKARAENPLAKEKVSAIEPRAAHPRPRRHRHPRRVLHTVSTVVAA